MSDCRRARSYQRYQKNCRWKKHCLLNRMDVQNIVLTAPNQVWIWVIAGAGTLGLGMITYARMKNQEADCFGHDRFRLEKAKEFGADIVMNPGTEDVVKR